ncbi:MAG: hypothetical protein V2I67_02615, partial [Thermoanaerobaculales bacterium]|nr:hypothetical protein [Thermoanaerobaculales bacterium]
LSASRVPCYGIPAGRRSPEQRGHLVLASHMTTLLGRRWATPPRGGGGQKAGSPGTVRIYP